MFFQKIEAEVVTHENEGKAILDALSNFGKVNMPQINPVVECQPYVEILEQPAPNKLRFR